MRNNDAKWLGSKWNKLTVIGFVHNEKDRFWEWECRCDCGGIIKAPPSIVRKGRVKTCGRCELPNDDTSWIGKRYGRLTVVGFTKRPRRNEIFWRCKCDCGAETVVMPCLMKNGHTQSCGCYMREKNGEREYKHGFSGTRLYNIWVLMKQRCNNPKATHYERYGGRGISVCPEWEVFENFGEWALANGYDDSLTIDRINNDSIYEPSNCRWVTMKEQSLNRSTNKKSFF